MQIDSSEGDGGQSSNLDLDHAPYASYGLHTLHVQT